MYQALYRKWRPRRFDDVVGQEHITQTLKRQVAQDRLSHAYLFTGTRGTGKTSCAKILAKAINCEQPEDGNPCNRCSACLGIDSGAIMDVLELDAASNNGVDQVRALRDEAVYTPATVRKRVYIIDEVHMLSTPAFNALLKILEEPPAHLLFILATTELHKVPATIKSRCQQFAFKRILPEEIVQRLGFVAKEEGIALSDEAATLMARLAEGGLRDALSLLDQCIGGGNALGEAQVLQVLGLAGQLEIIRLMDCIARGDTAAALARIAVLYREGKDMSALLGELSDLVRDLLIRKTAGKGGESLLSGAFEEAALRDFETRLDAAALFAMLTVLQTAAADLYRSSKRRTDVEICIIRLCEQGLSATPEALLARISRLEEQMARGGVPTLPDAATPPSAAEAPIPTPVTAEAPPWEQHTPSTNPPPPQAAQPEVEAPSAAQQAALAPQHAATGGESFKTFVAGVRGKIPPAAYTFLSKPSFVSGVFEEATLQIYVDSDMTKTILSRTEVQETLTQEAVRFTGRPIQLHIHVGKPEQTPPPEKAADKTEDKFDSLMQLGKQFGNITIK